VQNGSHRRRDCRCWEFDLLVSVAADVVGAESIDGDEKHVWGFFGRCLRRGERRREGRENEGAIAEVARKQGLHW